MQINMKNKILLTLVILFLLASSFTVFILVKSEQAMKQPLAVNDVSFFEIKKGSSFYHLSKKLVENGWLENRFWLRIYVRFNPELSKIKSGTYRVTPKTQLIEFLQQVVSGKEHQFSMTFIEGHTFKQILKQLSQHPNIINDVDQMPITDIANVLNIKYKNPEGWFFPDTYLFSNGTKASEILKRSYQRMKENLQQCWQQKVEHLPYEDEYQALIMASIIEKETAKRSEQKKIASVFINRLRKKMRLQTDPTIIYGLGEQYNGDITYANIREYTPYNTYRIRGLPPTPISSPGRDALCAAVNPVESEYLYFVSNGQGEHIFSKNLADHNKAVLKYQKQLKIKK